MRPAAHLRLAVTGPLVWAAFLLAGWPEYYQQYPTWLLVVGCVALLPPTAWFGFRVIDRGRPEGRLVRSAWLTFWLTVPLFLLDLVYCGWWLGHGAAFPVKYWYLTLYYVLPWVLWVPYGWWKSGR